MALESYIYVSAQRGKRVKELHEYAPPKKHGVEKNNGTLNPMESQSHGCCKKYEGGSNDKACLLDDKPCLLG